MFDWGDYLKLANELAQIDPSSNNAEAYYRCLISRAYYSVFHKSKDYILQNGGKLNRQYQEGSHQEVIAELTKIKGWEGGTLLKLKKNRTDSDYDGNKKIDQKMAKISIMYANNIFSSLT